jgi:hypothetical protein
MVAAPAAPASSPHAPTAPTRTREHAQEARRFAGFAAALAATDYPIPPETGVLMGQSLYRENRTRILLILPEMG